MIILYVMSYSASCIIIHMYEVGVYHTCMYMYLPYTFVIINSCVL